MEASVEVDRLKQAQERRKTKVWGHVDFPLRPPQGPEQEAWGRWISDLDWNFSIRYWQVHMAEAFGMFWLIVISDSHFYFSTGQQLADTKTDFFVWILGVFDVATKRKKAGISEEMNG